MKPFETKDYKAFTMFEDRWEPHYMYIGEVVEAIEG